MNKNYKKIRDRCRKGIPSAVRPKAWFFLSGGQTLLDAHPNVYQELLDQEGDPQIIEEIKRDQHRQFPMHEMFLDEERHGQKELVNLLKAYSILNPTTGYCQAQAPIAAFLLMHLPGEFSWCAFREKIYVTNNFGEKILPWFLELPVIYLFYCGISRD